ncbi:MAG: hypothetical protein K0R34_1162 [Herbinix sp.]|jgi:hypothetical protein|nr:hypothetical protein [Herbinix sp.]
MTISHLLISPCVNLDGTDWRVHVKKYELEIIVVIFLNQTVQIGEVLLTKFIE